MEHYRKLEQMYLHTNINSIPYKSTAIHVEEGKATINWEVSGNFFHALDALHGSVYFKLLDDAAFFAVSSLVEDVFVLTSSFNLHFLRPVNSGILRSEGEIRFRSRQLFIADARLINNEGKEVAYGSGTFLKSKVRLTPEIGYR